jgi:anti-sigma B factor antagonist
VNTTHRVVNTLTILRVGGHLTDGQELDSFRQAAEEATEGAIDLAIDLSKVEAIDSEGIGELARVLGRLSRRGGRLALIAPTPPVRKVLSVTRLDSVFHVLASEQAAIDVLVHGRGRSPAAHVLALL